MVLPNELVESLRADASSERLRRGRRCEQRAFSGGFRYGAAKFLWHGGRLHCDFQTFDQLSAISRRPSALRLESLVSGVLADG